MITHKGTQNIQTERLHLRKYSINDAEDIFKNYATDERVAKFLTWEKYENIEDLKTFIFSQINAYEDNIYSWVIEYQNEVIGSISVTEKSEKNKSCEIGYCIGFEFWNKGITTEAVSAVIKYLFEVGYHRIVAKHDVENPASGKVMMKCNMTYEGRLREYYLRHDGTYSDSLVYSILISEIH
ncbi:GNAT family N-acetyltransferase [Anaerosporobacter sp.]|uniref:GNAT family N-acetyltransferase n=1 Tax=Anaerosporobacter sp. TaxID=1872529 RepID=UPI00286F34DC|nr:GNAT family N-acetyltransferase [Anaerosporobacter sp.]